MNNLKKFLFNLITDKNTSFWVLPFKIVLSLFSFLYFIIIKIIFLFCSFRRKKFKVKIISIGNITWGGTGKTPLAKNIAEYLKEKNYSVAILGRFSDEISLLSKKLKDIPIVITCHKKEGIEKAIREYSPDIIILDDGFQQWGLEKDLDIVVIDSLNPFGNGWLIPRGILREPISSLKRADILVLNKVDLIKIDLDSLKELLRKINPNVPIFEALYVPKYLENLRNGKKEELDILREKDICLFSGIASPESLRYTVEKLGYKTKLVFEFLDHYLYKESDLIEICSRCIKEGIKELLTTEKDAIRLKPLIEKVSERFVSLSIFSLIVELEILDSEKFYARLLTFFNN